MQIGKLGMWACLTVEIQATGAYLATLASWTMQLHLVNYVS